MPLWNVSPDSWRAWWHRVRCRLHPQLCNSGRKARCDTVATAERGS